MEAVGEMGLEPSVWSVEIPDGPMGELLRWWLDTAYRDYQETVPKAVQYGGGTAGSADLQVMGDALAQFGNTSPGVLHQELACWFYALGKISRLISDYKAGKPGDQDHWFDLTVYGMMARRLADAGRWP